MKGFIELHEDITGDRSLIGIGNVACVADCHNEGTLIQFPTSQIGVRESYEEVKALIAEAQGDVDLKDYVSKKKLEEWIAFEENTLGKCKIIDMNPSEYSKMRNFLRKLRNFLKEEES